MSQTLTLDVPDEVYQALAAEAAAAGKSVTQVAGDRLAVTPPPASVAVKPGELLLKHAGTFDLGPGDVAERHHEYLSQAHLDTHEGAGP